MTPTTSNAARPRGPRRSVYEDEREPRKHRRWVGVLKDGHQVMIRRRESEDAARRAVGMRKRRKETP